MLITSGASIVLHMAMFSPEELRQATIHAKHRRALQVIAALKEVHAGELPGWDALPAAKEIDGAVRNRHGARHAERRAKIRQRLQQKLGSLDGIPQWERIRQLLGK